MTHEGSSEVAAHGGTHSKLKKLRSWTRGSTESGLTHGSWAGATGTSDWDLGPELSQVVEECLA